MPSNSKPAGDSRNGWLVSFESLMTTIVIAIFVITFITQAFQIPSASMESTLLVGDYLLVDKACYGAPAGSFFMPYRKVKHGDIIVFKYPVDPTQHFVKRVIGIPGDRLKLVNGLVFVNDVEMNEPYVQHIASKRDSFLDEFPRSDILVPGLEGKWWLQMKKLTENGDLIVPEDSYFVLGDNRDDSKDSRFWGFVPRENIIGRPLIIYWSVRDTSDDMPVASSPSDKLLHLTYAVTHLFQITRWDRTFRIVR
jgi:signal peptidase I